MRTLSCIQISHNTLHQSWERLLSLLSALRIMSLVELQNVFLAQGNEAPQAQGGGAILWKGLTSHIMTSGPLLFWYIALPSLCVYVSVGVN